MLDKKVINDFESKLDASEEERARIRNLVDKGKWKDAEPDQVRAARFRLKDEIKKKRNAAETQVGETLDWNDINFFTEAATIQKAVGYVKVVAGNAIKTGSGFMISPSLFMTNNHVIGNEQEAAGSVVTFNKQNDEFGRALPVTEFRFDPARFFLCSNQDELDFAIVAVGGKTSGHWNLADIGYFILSDAPDKHVLGMNVNIIQHPLDLPKKVTFRNNLLTYRTDNVLLYESDTETGSSGSPVCNDDWDLVAIHHWGEPYLAKQNNPDSTLPEFVNEGIRISTIYKQLSQQIENLGDGQRELLLQALSYAKTQPAITPKVPVRRPPMPPSPEVMVTTSGGGRPPSGRPSTAAATPRGGSGEMSLTIPLEITIRIGDRHPSAAGARQSPATANEFFAEASKIDTDYDNRSGYDENFIPGYTIPLPTINNPGDIAPLKKTETDWAGGLLNYEHFSLILNRKKRSAFFTATNIDGETYMRVNRETGEVTPRRDMNADEGEKWYEDERIDPVHHLNQPFFSGWSHLFDRGHLTRRTDPSWGTKKVALRADADTFHFSNCSIQHFRFNQTIPFWQGAERYVLENGFLTAHSDNHLVVFQGPVFDDRVDLWADDFQIPSKYFKIAIWDSASKGKLQAVGLIVDQSNLLSEQRRSLGQPRDVASVNVSQWRVPITDIQTATGLDFGKTVRDADTIGQAQPNVGEAFAKLPIRSWEDILQ